MVLLHGSVDSKKTTVFCESIIWLATRKKGLLNVCVKCHLGSGYAVRSGKSETTLFVLWTFSVYNKSSLAQNLMES